MGQFAKLSARKNPQFKSVNEHNYLAGNRSIRDDKAFSSDDDDNNNGVGLSNFNSMMHLDGETSFPNLGFVPQGK